MPDKVTHLSRMRRTVDECSEMLGETGQGINSEKETKGLTRTWGEC